VWNLYEGKSTGNTKKNLSANSEQISLVQLCHFSTFCPLHSMQVLQHFSNTQIPHAKKNPLAACAFPCARLYWPGGCFQQQPPWVAQRLGNHSKWDQTSKEDCGDTQMFSIFSTAIALSCCNKTSVPYSPRCSDLIAGLKWLLRTWPCEGLGIIAHACLVVYKWVSVIP
jgi:hypothetical protein